MRGFFLSRDYNASSFQKLQREQEPQTVFNAAQDRSRDYTDPLHQETLIQCQNLRDIDNRIARETRRCFRAKHIAACSC